MSIVCVGQTAYDITLPIHEPLIENQKYRIFEKIECLGGPAANAAYLCAKWNAPTKLVSRIGKDAYGNEIIKTMENIGLDCEYVVRTDTTPLSIILNNQMNGSRTIFNNPGFLEPIDINMNESIDVILTDGHELSVSLKMIEDHPEAVSVLDAGTCRENTIELAKKVDYLVCSYDFARKYVEYDFDCFDRKQQQEVFKKLHKLNSKQIVVTLGENGLLYESEGSIVRMPAYKVNAVDTTGAGDIFHGAFAYAIHEKYDLENALELASMTSAISVTKVGGNISIPSLEEVKNNLKENLR